ncbi:bacterial Ig-like domain-containing protein [Paenibacillus sp. TAB 01]|uniref:bacterial Ig-like domain-containing protein n=1 Tax=Paenibacillus sp. TAB 01 TaxID=3368988 RepID=UPI003750A6F1
MRQPKRLLAMVMSFVLLVSLLPLPASADQAAMIQIGSDWQGSVFGDVGGQDKITASNFEITENNDSTVTLRSSNDRGKIAGSSEGIAYYFKEVPADQNFELSATATVETFAANNQVSFGLMLRNKAAGNTSFTTTDVTYATYFSNYVAVGALDQSMKGFYSQDSTLIKTGYEFDSAAPAPGKSYDLSIRKTGSAYTLRIGDQVQVIDHFSGNIAYAGLYTARNTKVTFSNVHLNVDPLNLGDWKFSAFGSGTSGSTNPAPDVQSNDPFVLKAAGGKISSTDEGISYFYKEIPANANIEISARATIKSFNGTPDSNSNQKSFGVMLKQSVGVNTSNYIQVGGFGGKVGASNFVQAFYKQSSRNALDAFNNVKVPAVNEVYDFTLKKSGDAYEITVNGTTQRYVVKDLFAGKFYAGLYAARDAEITFSNYRVIADSRVPSQIIADTSAMKTAYLIGESLELKGLKVKAVYPDSHEELLSEADYVVTGFDSSTAGSSAAAVHFNGETAELNLSILKLDVTGLQIQYFPAKTTYYPGDVFDPNGFAIRGTYNNGYKVEQLTEDQYVFSIPGAIVTGTTYVLTAPGTQKVIVTSAETPATSVEFDIIVKDAALTGLEIKQLPQKTLYYLGDTLDLDGLVVYAKYSDGQSVRLTRNELTVSPLDTSAEGAKTLTVTHKGQSADFSVTVKQKSLTGIQTTQYPKTTYTVGESFDAAGLIVSKVYDNGDLEVLSASDYMVDTAAYNKDIPGTYDILVVPNDVSLAPIVLKATVRAGADAVWKSIRFGQSTSSANNNVTVNGNGTVRVEALEGGGKVTGDHDGISFYYTELDAALDNFELSADIKVIAYAKTPFDGQESFGIMARDAIGAANDSSVFASNIAAVGGYSGGTKGPNGTQLFVRTGVTSRDGAGSKGIQTYMLKNEQPNVNNTYPAANYRLKLVKTNSGYTGSLNNVQEPKPKQFFYEPDMLNVQDSKMYVGFYAARLATIEVSNIELHVTNAATDAPKEEAPKQPITPQMDIVSLNKTSSANYDLKVKANVNGTLIVKEGLNIIAQDIPVTAGTITSVPAGLQEGDTNFSATLLPDDTQNLTSYDNLIQNFTVTMKIYAPGGDIYVAPAGKASGAGTSASPLDLDTAIDYVRPGQRIIVQGGTYARTAKLEIKKYNDGTADALKYLVAAPGVRPLIDFGKNSEGVVLSGNYWHVTGIDFARSAPNTKGFTVGGSYNIVELNRFYEHGDTGMQISRTDDSEDKSTWPSYNLILNNESFDNRDPADNNADGFAAKLTSGVGNIFRGDISHNNIDDGWDLYTKAGSGAIGAVIIENSIAYNNGTLTDGTVGKGDKNGFKLGGEGIHVPHIIRNSIAFGNGAYGFTSNSNPGVIAENNNVGFNNARGNLNFTTYTNIPTDFRINGFVSYQKNVTAKDNYPAELSSDTNFLFNGTASVNKSGVQLNDANFVSLQPALPYQRDAAGNIIWGDFLKFVAPGTDSGTNPGTDPGTNPGTDPGTNPGTDPGTDPGMDPNEGTIAAPTGLAAAAAQNQVTLS